MKQIWPNYSYSPTTNVLTLTGLNIDRDQLLLVSAPEPGRIMYNFADSTVTASAFTAGANTGLTLVASTAGLTTTAALVIYYDDQLASSAVTISSLPAISGTVTANLNLPSFAGGDGDVVNQAVKIGYYDETYEEFRGVSSIVSPLPITVTNLVEASLRSDTTLPAGTNRIGVVTIGGGTVTIGAGTSQIGSVTASISNSVVTFYPMQGTSVSNTNFTSITASTSLVSAVAGREVLTIFSEGPGQLFVSPGATATTISYQVRLSAGDYWECPQGQLSLAHTAVFATAGTARVTEVS